MDGPTIIIGEPSRPSHKQLNKQKSEKVVRNDDDETVVLSEKLGSIIPFERWSLMNFPWDFLATFSQQNLSSKRPKFNFGKSKKSITYDVKE